MRVLVGVTINTVIRGNKNNAGFGSPIASAKVGNRTVFISLTMSRIRMKPPKGFKTSWLIINKFIRLVSG